MTYKALVLLRESDDCTREGIKCATGQFGTFMGLFVRTGQCGRRKLVGKVKYSVLDYPSRVKECFSFLTTDYGYSLLQEEAKAFSFINRYEKGSLRILLICDIRDNVFDFWIMRGEVDGFPDHADPNTAKTMYDLFKQHEKNLDFRATQPDDGQYLDALRLNAQLLRAYGGEVLSGNGWF